MSTEALAATGMPPSELAVSQRVQQLQALIEQTGQAASGRPATAASTVAPGASGSSFAETLQAATGASAPPAAGATAAANQGTGEAGQSSQYDGLIETAARRYGLDPAVLHGLIQQESGFDPSSQSSAGASGLTQLMPATASSMGVANPLNPAESIEGGARYLSQMMGQFAGNTTDALAAYNAGPGAVTQYGGVPPYAETQSYVSKVLGYAEAFRQGHPSASAGVPA